MCSLTFIHNLELHYSKGFNLPYCKVFQILFITENEISIFVPVKFLSNNFGMLLK